MVSPLGTPRSLQGRRIPPRPGGSSTPALLVVGHVCRDVIGHHERLGGAAAFAARAAACLGIPTGVVTAAPADFALLTPLHDDPCISLSSLPCPEATAFKLDYSGSVRRIHLLSRAPNLHVSMIPPGFARAPVAYVAPVIGECDRALVAELSAACIVCGLQGWLRKVDTTDDPAPHDAGLVTPHIAPHVLDPPANLTAAVFSEQDHPDAEALALHLANCNVLVALTRGPGGVTLFQRRHTVHVDAAPASERDPTGAGDVFGVVFALALQRGLSPVEAARQAAFAAARVVEGPGLGNLPAVRPAESCIRLSPQLVAMTTPEDGWLDPR